MFEWENPELDYLGFCYVSCVACDMEALEPYCSQRISQRWPLSRRSYQAVGNAEMASVPHNGCHENSGGFQTALSFKSVYMWYVTGFRSHWGRDTQCQLQPFVFRWVLEPDPPHVCREIFPSFGAWNPLSLWMSLSHCTVQTHANELSNLAPLIISFLMSVY